ncbi:N2227-domain-containing protein [Peniophora sp. CONT]|nr:N2227-domain-containing protein [Peniophora sp. CONT]
MSSRTTDDTLDDEEAHFFNVVATFRKYGPYALSANNRRRKDLYTLPRSDQELLGSLGYKEKLAEVDSAIQMNAEFLHEIAKDPGLFEEKPEIDDSVDSDRPIANEATEESVTTIQNSVAQSHSHGLGGHSHDHGHDHDSPRRGKYKPTDFDMEKLRSTLKQFVRDWSTEGEEEREASYKPLKDALLAHFSDIPFEERYNFRVLVPGAGLGRLAYDIAKLGFSCQGNEFSHYMLLSSFHILNRTEQIEQYTIYPYVHSFSNMPNRDALLRPIRVPDVLPSDIPPDSSFSLVAGDFEEVYGKDDFEEDDPSSGQWDAIVTCFFIDTAKNIVNYLRIMHKILAPGGVWVNIGPLLWHFENNTSNDPSIELDLEEVKELARKIGFDIKEERTYDTTYVSNKQGMLGYTYRAAFWTATKRI